MQPDNPSSVFNRSPEALPAPSTMSSTYPTGSEVPMPSSGYIPDQSTVPSYTPHQTQPSLFQSSAEVPRFVVPYRFWEDEAKTILMAYDTKSLQRVIRYRLFPDENLPRKTLRNRNANTVETFLVGLIAPQEAPLVAELSHIQKVEEIIRRSRIIPHSYVPWTWFPSPETSDPQAIAAAIDAESHLQFARIPFEEWVRYSLGYRVISVEWFLQQHTNLSFHLLNHLQGFTYDIQTYLAVEKELRNRSPFAHRAVAQCLLALLPGDKYDIRMSSTPGFDFIASPIQRLFSSHSTTLMGILKVLSVLAIRFRQTYVHTAQMDWNMPFDVDTSSIQGLFDSTSSYDFVRLRTNSDEKAFVSLSPEGVIANDSLTRQYLANWEKLVSSVFECCSALPDRIEYIQECVQSLFNNRNYHSVMAILTGLQRYSVTSSTLSNITSGPGMVTPNAVVPPEFFYLINPWDNYTAYREQFCVAPGIPFLFPHISQAMQEGPGVIHMMFQQVNMR